MGSWLFYLWLTHNILTSFLQLFDTQFCDKYVYEVIPTHAYMQHSNTFVDEMGKKQEKKERREWGESVSDVIA